MIPFRLKFEPGASLFDQTVYAVKRAMVAGQLRPGDPFPSVRALSRELKINPNTAHKVVTHLIAEGLLQPVPGIGTVVATPAESSRRERADLLGHEVESLVVEAMHLGIDVVDLQSSIARHWEGLSRAKPGKADVQPRPKRGEKEPR